MLKVDKFTRGYLEAALWSSTYDDGEREDRPMDDDFDVDVDLSPAMVRISEHDCAYFQKSNRKDLRAAKLPPEEAGQMFWLNRNGHGVGYWDRPGGPVGERLSDAAHTYGSVDLYVGDDRKIHVTGE
jgi:hypothetical protein